MKITLKNAFYSAAAAAVLTGCGGGGGSLADGTMDTVPPVSKKITQVQASDAYVVSLITPATLKVDGKEFNSTRVDANGTITFDVPDDLNLSKAEIFIPADAIVDADGDGNLSDKDQIIRMALKAKGEGSVANPLATAALEKGDLESYNHFKKFDPVKAKEELLQDNNATLEALVAVNDAIATLVKEANSTKPSNILKDIKLDKIKQIVKEKPEVVDIDSLTVGTINDAVSKAGVDEDKITTKTREIVNVIKTVRQAIKDKKIKSHKEGLKAVIAVSDADVNATVVEKAINEGNITNIENKIKINDRVKRHKEDRDKKNSDSDETMPGMGQGGNGEDHKPQDLVITTERCQGLVVTKVV